MFADTTYTTGQGRCQRREPHELAATWRAMTGSSGGRGPGGEGDRAHGHGRQQDHPAGKSCESHGFPPLPGTRVSPGCYQLPLGNPSGLGAAYSTLSADW